MQRILIVLVLGLLSVGCLTPEQKQQKALRDSVVGEYERKRGDGDTIKHVYLENGVREAYTNGKKGYKDYTWKIVDGEVHVKYGDHGSFGGFIRVWKINQDKSITWIAKMYAGPRRIPFQFQDQWTLKKIK